MGDYRSANQVNAFSTREDDLVSSAVSGFVHPADGEVTWSSDIDYIRPRWQVHITFLETGAFSSGDPPELHHRLSSAVRREK